MEKKKYQNPTMGEIEVKEQLLVGGSPETPETPGEGGNNSRSTSSFDDAE